MNGTKQLFQYVILHHEFDKDGKYTGKTTIVKELSTLLASSVETAKLVLSAEIPKEYLESPKVEGLEVLLRPF